MGDDGEPQGANSVDITDGESQTFSQDNDNDDIALNSKLKKRKVLTNDCNDCKKLKLDLLKERMKNQKLSGEITRLNNILKANKTIQDKFTVAYELSNDDGARDFGCGVVLQSCVYDYLFTFTEGSNNDSKFIANLAQAIFGESLIGHSVSGIQFRQACRSKNNATPSTKLDPLKLNILRGE